jgi:hypothetical protein
MDPLLIALLAVSLVSAAGFGGFAWHLLREERERSAARVAALSSAIDGASPAVPTPAVAELFAPKASAAARGNPLIKGAVGVAMALVLIVVVASANRGSDSPAAAAGAEARTSAPLELISMRHTREGDRLTVTGLVRNPRAGPNTTRVTAVILAFNRAGAFINSARAPLDFTTLEPGDESPFVVTLPSAADVGRYRVSFRTDTGVVRHVDRRASDSTRLTAARLR